MNIDNYIWHSETNYYCEENDFNKEAETELLPGTDILVYNEESQKVVSAWFVNNSKQFIKYTDSGGGEDTKRTYLIKNGQFVNNGINKSYYRFYSDVTADNFYCKWGGSEDINSTFENGYWASNVINEHYLVGTSQWYFNGNRLIFELKNAIKIPKNKKVVMECNAYLEVNVVNSGHAKFGGDTPFVLAWAFTNKDIPVIGSDAAYGPQGTRTGSNGIYYPFLEENKQTYSENITGGSITKNKGVNTWSKEDIVATYTTDTEDMYKYFGYGWNKVWNGRYLNQYTFTKNSVLKIKNIYYTDI